MSSSRDLTDVQPVWIYQESERATVPDAPSSLDNAVAPTQSLYGWLVHQLWEAHEEALLAKIYKATSEPGTRRQQAQITKEKARSSVEYLRIPAAITTVKGLKFMRRNVRMPGKAVQVATAQGPLCYSDAPKTEKKPITVKLDVLRVLNERSRLLMHYTNILCHTTDVLHQLAVRNTAPAIADRELIEDTLFVAKRTSNNMMGSQVSTNLNHVIYERHLALNRDDRKALLQLCKSKQAKARLAPYDFDDFLSGSELDVQGQDIKDKREKNK